MRKRRRVPKATDVSVHIGEGAMALILQFITLREGEFTIAVPVQNARTLAKVLEMKAKEAEALTSHSESKTRH